MTILLCSPPTPLQLQHKAVTAGLHCPENVIPHNKPHSSDLLGGNNPGEPLALPGWEKATLTELGTELFRGRALSVKISRVRIGWISVPEFGQAQRLAGFCAQGLVVYSAQGLIGFYTELVWGRVCFFDLGNHVKVCFFHSSF